MKTALVTGAGGFIGNALVTRLTVEGYHVRAVDIKEPDFGPSVAQEFVLYDLLDADMCFAAVADMDEVYHLAADMGGIGYIGTDRFGVAIRNVTSDMNMLDACTSRNTKKFFFSSSACIYPVGKQEHGDVQLVESDAWPAQPEEGYGLEKLFMEKMCEYAQKEFSLETHVARFHNIYGPFGTYQGGREKSPAALCRKVAEVDDGGEIEIWGDGTQLRSYCYIDDCVEGIRRLMGSDEPGPVNIGSEESISISEMAEMIVRIAEKENIRFKYDTSKPQGVHSRNSNSEYAFRKLGWKPQVTLEDGLRRTYDWILGRVVRCE